MLWRAGLAALLCAAALAIAGCDDRTYAPNASDASDAGSDDIGSIDADRDADADDAADDAADDDPPYERACQRDDFVCDDIACDPGPGEVLRYGECYLRCENDSGCPEPERPFCIQIGLFEGGDFACNAIERICLGVRIDEQCL